MDINLVVDDKKVNNLLRQISTHSKNIAPLMKTISETVLSSVQKNFDVGGRYSLPGTIEGGEKKWEKSERAEQQKGQTLIDTRRLLGSISSRSSSKTAEVGTNVVYAAIHNFGGDIPAHIIRARNAKALSIPTKEGIVFRKSAKIPEISMPARPFMVVQQEDLKEIEKQSLLHLLKTI